MADPCERRDSKWVERLVLSLMDANDRRYEQRFMAQERALDIERLNNQHWKAEADSWRKRADERERTFLSRGAGYVIAAVAVATLVLQAWRFIQ